MAARRAVDEDPARSVALLWGAEPRPRRGPKPALSRAAIVARATEIADAEGLAAVTIVRLAKEFGAGNMSLYRYVPGRAELVDLLLDAAIGPPPALHDVAGGWRPRLERWARECWAVFRRHPWALQVIADRRVMGPNELAWFEAALQAVAGTGLPERAMVDVVLLLNAYVRGAAQGSVAQAQAERRTGVGTDAWAATNASILARVLDDDRYPVLSAVLAAGALAPDADPGYDRDFEFGLPRVLDSIAAWIADSIRPR